MRTSKKNSTQYFVGNQQPVEKTCKGLKKLTQSFKLILLICIISFSTTYVNAQDEPRQAINICAIAIPVMNIYVVNYEYLYQSRHGLAARIGFAPKLEDADTKGVGWQAVLNYRWHFSPKLKNFFVGPYLRYNYVYGSGMAEESNYDFNVHEVNLGLNGGYRWVSKIGINVVFAAGYGYSIGKENLMPTNPAIESAFSAFKNANNTNSAFLDAPYYAEFSIGYAF